MKPAEREAQIEKQIRDQPQTLVFYYLGLSWLYYEQDMSLVPDELFDRICKRLLDEFPQIQHRHKHLVDLESLRAGTGYALTNLPNGLKRVIWSMAVEDGFARWNKRKKQWERRK